MNNQEIVETLNEWNNHIEGWFWSYDKAEAIRGSLVGFYPNTQFSFIKDCGSNYANFSIEKPALPKYHKTCQDLIDWVNYNPERVVKFSNKTFLAKDIDLQIGNVEYFKPKPEDVEVLKEMENGTPYWLKLSLIKKGGIK